jgi:hypothetical protein
VGEPADATTGNVFEVLAARIEELIISLFIADASNSVRALRFDIRNPLIGRRPAILSIRREHLCEKRKIQDTRGDITSSKYIFFPEPWLIK